MRKYVQRKFVYFLISLSLLVLASCSTTNDYLHYNTASSAASAMPPKQIALLLPLSGPMGGPGRAVRDGFMASYYPAIQSGQINTKIRVYDTMHGDIEHLYEQAILDGADCVVGPLEKEKVQRIMSSPVPVTTIVLNYSTTPYSGTQNLYQFGLSPLDEAQQVAQYAYQRGQRSAILIAPAGSWGAGVAQAFRMQWQQLGGRVVTQFFYTPNQDLSPYIRQVLQVNDNLAAGLNPRFRDRMMARAMMVRQPAYRRQDADMIFMVALPPKARQINPLLKFYYAGDLPVYSISLVYSGIPAPMYDQDLNGIVFDDMPWVFNPKAAQLSPFPRLYGLGMDTFTVVMKRGQWKNSPNSTIQGYTGVLSLNPGNRISRKLVWGKFVQGEVHTLE